jgi:ABC-2 type transport system permease protein
MRFLLDIVASFAYYLKIWWMMSKNAFLAFLQNRLAFFIFLTGKILRFVFFLGFLFFILKKTQTLAGYTLNQTIFFFLTFNLIDIVSQFLFREVYRFRPLVVSGRFDLVLIKPMSALFRVLMGGADVIDLVTIPPLVAAVFYVGRLLNPSMLHAAYYVLLIINGLLIATAFHIAVVSLGIITLEIDHTIMIYRDVGNLGKLPVDIYKEPLKAVITYLIPVGLMITIPAKALMGLVSPLGIVASFLFGITLLFGSLKFWNFALKYYTSASS